MRRSACTEEVLRRLAEMPFLDRLEAAAVSGWSKGAVYNAIEALERDGLASSVRHSSELVPPTRRYSLTTAGLHRLARAEGVAVEELLRTRPVSAQWRRVLLRRLDATAVIYRLAADVANAAHPIRFRWFRTAPLDAAIVLPGGRTLGVVRQGSTVGRTAFSRRLWRLRLGDLPGALLIVVPDVVRLDRAHALLEDAPLPAFLALERDVVAAGGRGRVWRTPSGERAFALRAVLSRFDRRGAVQDEPQPARASLPEWAALDAPVARVSGWLWPARLRSAEKRMLDLLADWPWAALNDLAGLLGVSHARAAHLGAALESRGLVTPVLAAGRCRLALSDSGLRLIAHRDRTSVAVALRRWSTGPVDAALPLAWRNVSGTRSRTLLRHVEHTEAVHGFLAALARQARETGWEPALLAPSHQSSRFFRHDGALHAVRPDAFGILRKGGREQSFFLECERRAVRPSTITARLAPYLRYFSARRDEHGPQPAVLVVFDDLLAAILLQRIARREMARMGVHFTLRVSDAAALKKAGPMGRAWRSPGRWEPTQPPFA